MSWFFSLILSSVMADAVSLDHIFSEDIVKGGISCSAFSTAELPGGFFDSPVQTYQKPFANGKAAKGPMTKLRTSCTQGGGECECNLLYTDEVDAGGGNSYFSVKLLEGSKPVWILTAKKATSPTNFAISGFVLTTRRVA